MSLATSAPPATGSEPPSQKSFCTSTTISPRFMTRIYRGSVLGWKPRKNRTAPRRVVAVLPRFLQAGSSRQPSTTSQSSRDPQDCLAAPASICVHRQGRGMEDLVWVGEQRRREWRRITHGVHVQSAAADDLAACLRAWQY